MKPRLRVSWLRMGLPVTCGELAEAMYRSAQRRSEVEARLRAMGRWDGVTVRKAAHAFDPHGARGRYGRGALLPASDQQRKFYEKLRYRGGFSRVAALREVGL